MKEIFEGLHSDLNRPRLLCTFFSVNTINDLKLPNATIPKDLSIKDKVLLFYEFEQAHSGNWIYRPTLPPKRNSHNDPPYNSRVLPEILLFYLCSYCLLITEERKLIERINTTEKTIKKLRKIFHKLSLSPVHDISPKKVEEDLDKYLKINNDCTITLELIKSIKEQITDKSSLLQPQSACSADLLVSFTQIHDELELHYDNHHDQIQAKYSLHTPSLSQIYDWLDKEAQSHSTLTFSNVNSQLSTLLQDTSYPLSFCYVFSLTELYLFRKLLTRISTAHIGFRRSCISILFSTFPQTLKPGSKPLLYPEFHSQISKNYYPFSLKQITLTFVPPLKQSTTLFVAKPYLTQAETCITTFATLFM